MLDLGLLTDHDVQFKELNIDVWTQAFRVGIGGLAVS